MVENNDGNSGGDEGYNVFRDSLLRYMGYANEVGESFRYQFPKIVLPSYAVAFGYVFADAVNSGNNAYQRAVKEDAPSALLNSVASSVDSLIWQSLASVLIPGATINAIVRASRVAVARSPAAVPAAVLKWVPTAMGLGSVPLIIRPIDHGVDLLMDSTFRQINFSSLALGSNESGLQEPKQ